jgi:hypothetical protein
MKTKRREIRHDAVPHIRALAHGRQPVWMSEIIQVPELPCVMFLARRGDLDVLPYAEETPIIEKNLEFRFRGRIDEATNCPPDGRVYVYELGRSR